VLSNGIRHDVKEVSAKVKTHLHNNKKVYIAGASCLVAGMLIAPKQVVIVDALKGIQWKSPAANEVIAQLIRRGHPGNIVKCIETGIPYASQNQAAQQNGIDPSIMSRHLNGHLENAGGKHFKLLGEAR
jgi:hypothetical protein